MEAEDNGSRPVFSRRAAIQKLGGISLGAAMVLLAARGQHAYAAVATVRRQWGGEKTQRAYYRTKPRWASWTVPQLNVHDGWSQPSGWMATIENSHHLPYIHDNFNRLLPVTKLAYHWVMVIDLRKCIGCQACVVACKSENNVPVGVYRTWVQVVETGAMIPDPQGSVVTDQGRFTPNVKRFSLPRLCNHCDNPPCVEVCPVKATFKREDGLVLIDYPKCLGCGYCIQACPYDARFFNPIQQTADKCTFCVQRLDRGLLPACVTSCVGRARVFGDLNDPQSAVAQLIAQQPTSHLKSTMGTNPQVFYIGLDGTLAEDGADSFNTIYPYAVGTNTEEYDDLTGQVLLQTPTGGERGTP
jgi:Fe-S-cluster-containing dehydrogenase component